MGNRFFMKLRELVGFDCFLLTVVELLEDAAEPAPDPFDFCSSTTCPLGLSTMAALLLAWSTLLPVPLLLDLSAKIWMVALSEDTASHWEEGLKQIE